MSEAELGLLKCKGCNGATVDFCLIECPREIALQAGAWEQTFWVAFPALVFIGSAPDLSKYFL